MYCKFSAWHISTNGLNCYLQFDGKEAQEFGCKESATLCTKIVRDGEVTKGCYTGKKPRTEECIVSAKANTTECFCSGDLCNSSTRSTGLNSAILALTSILATVVFRMH